MATGLSRSLRRYLGTGAGAEAGDRADRFVGAVGPAPATSADETPSDMVRRLRREVERIKRRTELPPAPARAHDQARRPERPATVDEAGLLVRHDHAPGQTLGRTPLTAPGAADLERIARLGQLTGAGGAGEPPEAPEHLLFLDLETNGLSRGAGNLAFIVGMATWTGPGGGLRVEQVFLDDPSREAEALACVAPYLQRARVVVTFNGRGFDVPVLRTRSVMCGVPLDLDRPAQLDLLPPCRRLLRPRLENCRQVSVEAHLLGFRRVDDVPGAEAPERYETYLRTGSMESVEPVLEHNRLDVAAMAAMVGIVARHACDPLHWAEDAEELLGAAALHRTAGDPDLAEACLERGLELGCRPATRRRLLMELGAVQRRGGGREAAVPTWTRLRDEFPHHRTGWVELAKYHEHDRRDPERALSLCQRAPGVPDPELRRRLERLLRKVET